MPPSTSTLAWSARSQLAPGANRTVTERGIRRARTGETELAPIVGVGNDGNTGATAAGTSIRYVPGGKYSSPPSSATSVATMAVNASVVDVTPAFKAGAREDGGLATLMNSLPKLNAIDQLPGRRRSSSRRGEAS